MANRQILDPRWEFDITEYVGKRLAFTLALVNENNVAVDLTGYTGEGKIVDEENVTILDLSPTITAASGYYVVNLDVPSDTPPGRYDWVGALVSGGVESVRFRGKVNLLTY